MDGMEEGIVVGEPAGWELPEEKMDMSCGGNGSALDVIAGRKRGVVALHGCAGGRFGACAGRKLQGDLGLDVERRAEIDGGGAWRGFVRRIGQT